MTSGDRLAALALEAARRQADNTWALAMLREWGQQAEDRGDRTTAESRWAAMLDLVSVGRRGPPEARTSTAAGTGRRGPGRGRAAAGDGTPAVTPERFEQAAEIARLAANHGRFELSLRAVREVLRGGPPVVVVPLASGANRAALAATNARSHSRPSPEASALARLAELEGLWRDGKVSPALVYETLRDVVLPPARPADLFLYAAPLAAVDRAPAAVRSIPPRPRSAAALLAHWAVAAGRSDELRDRIAQRQTQPAAELNALVLLASSPRPRDNPRRSQRRWRPSAGNFKRTPCSRCRARLSRRPARPRRRAAGHGPRCGRDHRARGAGAGVRHRGGARRHDAPDARPVRVRPCEPTPKGESGSGKPLARPSTPLPARSSMTRSTVASGSTRPPPSSTVRAGLDAEAPRLARPVRRCAGRCAGRPAGGESLVALAHWVAARPGAERYDRLKAWSFPTPTRKTVRLLAGFVPVSLPPEDFHQVADTASLLIAAARETGKLDELGIELGELDRQGVENARALLILVEVARPGRLRSHRWPRPSQRICPGSGRKRTRRRAAEPTTASPPAWSDILVARGCLAEPRSRRWARRWHAT